jgi:ribosomal protein S18 acetylase RimI-like enzyme
LIRPATAADRATIEAIVNAAYAKYIARIGKPPGPMLDDYGVLIGQGAVHVVADPDGTIAALIVLLLQTDHLLLDNIAVHPDRQGGGLGRRLIAFAEDEAHRLGFRDVRLYTHATMTENIALYRRLGFKETGRAEQGGYDRVFMCKRLTR